MDSNNKSINLRIIFILLISLVLYSIFLDIFRTFGQNFVKTYFDTEVYRAIAERLGRGTLVELVVPYFLAFIFIIFKTNKKWWKTTVTLFVFILLLIISVKGIATIIYQTGKLISKPSYLMMKRDIDILNSLPLKNKTVLADPITSRFISYNNKDFNLISLEGSHINPTTRRIFNPIFRDEILFHDLLNNKIDYIIVNTAILPLETLNIFVDKPRYFDNICCEFKESNIETRIPDINSLIKLFKRKDFITIKKKIIKEKRQYISYLIDNPLAVYRVNRGAMEISNKEQSLLVPFDFDKSYLSPLFYDYHVKEGGYGAKAVGYNYLYSNVLKVNFDLKINIKKIEISVNKLFPEISTDSTIEIYLVDSEKKDIFKDAFNINFKTNEKIKNKVFEVPTDYKTTKEIYIHVYNDTIDDRYEISKVNITTYQDKSIEISLKE